MIKTLVTEDVEVIDSPNKLSNNDYIKTVKIFGCTIYSYRYTVKMRQADKESKPLGFGK